MPRIRMIDVGLPYKKIMQGSKWVGRVYKNTSGTYTGQIGKGSNRIEVTGATEREAFDEVGARFFGHASAASLRSHNSQVRVARPRRRRHAGMSMLDEIERLLLGGARTPSRRPLSAEEETQAAMARAEMGEDDFVYRTNASPRRRH